MSDLPSITISATAALPPRDSYFITVLGAMTPAIHHPHWYRHIGIIDEAELQGALTNGSLSTNPLGSQLKFGEEDAISINCQPAQWVIQANDEGAWERMIDITAIVFERLNDTPVSGFALTIQRHVQTNAMDVKDVLARLIRKLNLGMPPGKSIGSSIGLGVINEDFRMTVSVQPSVLGERDVFMLYQRQFEIPSANAQLAYFDLGPLVRNRLNDFRNDGASFMSSALETIQDESGGEVNESRNE